MISLYEIVTKTECAPLPVINRAASQEWSKCLHDSGEKKLPVVDSLTYLRTDALQDSGDIMSSISATWTQCNCLHHPTSRYDLCLPPRSLKSHRTELLLLSCSSIFWLPSSGSSMPKPSCLAALAARLRSSLEHKDCLDMIRRVTDLDWLEHQRRSCHFLAHCHQHGTKMTNETRPYFLSLQSHQFFIIQQVVLLGMQHRNRKMLEIAPALQLLGFLNEIVDASGVVY